MAVSGGPPMDIEQSPLEYLLSSSTNSLDDFELARLNQISNLRKEFSQLFEAWFEAEIEARLARAVLDGRRSKNVAYVSNEPAGSRQISLPLSSPAPASYEQLAFPCEHLTPRRRKLDSETQIVDVSAPELPISVLQRRTAACSTQRETPSQSLRLSTDAAAALRSLEQIAGCTRQSNDRNDSTPGNSNSHSMPHLSSTILFPGTRLQLRLGDRSAPAVLPCTQSVAIVRDSSIRAAKPRRFHPPNFAPGPSNSRTRFRERRAGLIDCRSFAMRSGRSRLRPCPPFHGPLKQTSYSRNGTFP